MDTIELNPLVTAKIVPGGVILRNKIKACGYPQVSLSDEELAVVVEKLKQVRSGIVNDN